MSGIHAHIKPSIGFLLLRDGHAIPLVGIFPDAVKAGAKCCVPHPEASPLKYRQTLNAIVDRLGFRGDWGDFLSKGWKEFEAFLVDNNCTHRAGLFPQDHGGCIDLWFTEHSGPNRRALADRIFEAPSPAPRRVFLGYGVDWKAWDSGGGHSAPSEAIATLGGDPSAAAHRADALFFVRAQLPMPWGFLDNSLVEGPLESITPKIYWTRTSTTIEKERELQSISRALLAFRAVFDDQPQGWVDVLPFNDRLVVLRGYDGGWDVLWRDYRADLPPKSGDISRAYELATEDLPTLLMSKNDLRRRLYFRQSVWDEQEAHVAEQAFYDAGGTPTERRNMEEAEVRVQWLRSMGKFPVPRPRNSSLEIPPGFKVLTIAGRSLAISELITVGAFRQMLSETNYLQRRPHSAEPWERANTNMPDTAPVGASWTDAMAFCAWQERLLGQVVRLPGTKELRALHPFFSDRYAQMAGGDFWWERFPPRPLLVEGLDGTKRRQDLPGAVSWSEPRFLAPSPTLPEFPDDSGLSRGSRKRWIEDFPPHGPWVGDLPWAEYHGLRFIDAWDAYEWCQECEWISGRFWEGMIGRNSWGAYKNVKVTFRLVLDMEG